MVAELQPSKLGTKEYWASVYEEELANFEEIGDEGEIWFGVESVEKMVKWTLTHAPLSSQPSILEVGSGNGTLLFSLAEAGYKPTTLTGIDYTSDAIELAKAIASKRGLDGITFKQCDFLKDGLGSGSWDLVLDKGTYDAIALGTKDENGCSPAAQYPSQLKKYLKPGSIFLITSCNFTEEELQAAFATPESKLVYQLSTYLLALGNWYTQRNRSSRIQHAIYTFGGNSGSICASIAFQEPAV